MNSSTQTPHEERTTALEQSLPECAQLLYERLHARMDSQEELLKLILTQTKALRVESHSAIGVDDMELRILPDIDSGMSKKNIFLSEARASKAALSPDDLERKRRQDAVHVSNSARLGSGSDVAPLEKGPQHRIQHRMQQITGSTTFGVCTCLAIFANTLIVGFEVELSGSPCCKDGTTAASIFSRVQLGFTGLFFIETVMRILAKGCRVYFFHNPEKNWDFFDLALVLTSVLEIIVNSTTNANIKNLVLLRVMRFAQIVSRASRIMRLLKVARFFRPIRVIVRSLYYTLRSLVWIIVSLAMIMYVFALVFTSTTSDHVNVNSNASEHIEQLKLKFGTIPRSMFSLYSAVSGGIDWEPLVFMLAEVHAFWGAMFVFFQFFIFFAVMNVITGVCCEGAIESAYKDASLTVEAHLANLDVHVGRFTDIFKEIDSDGSGSLTIGELEEHLGDPRIKAYFESMDIDAQDAWTLFSLLDTDKTNDVDAQEFVRGCLRLKGSAKAVDVVKLNFETRWMANKIHNLSREFRLFQNEFARVNRLLVAAFPKSHRKSGKQCIGL